MRFIIFTIISDIHIRYKILDYIHQDQSAINELYKHS